MLDAAADNCRGGPAAPGPVPNDLSATSEHPLSVLTGANMSGKSTHLRSAVLLQVRLGIRTK